MDELGIERADLVGSSFGAAVALRVALAAPTRVTRLFLSSAPSPEVEPSAELQSEPGHRRSRRFRAVMSRPRSKQFLKRGFPPMHHQRCESE